MTRTSWSELERQRLLELVEAGENWETISQLLNTEFSTDRNPDSCFWYNQRLRKEAKKAGESLSMNNLPRPYTGQKSGPESSQKRLRCSKILPTQIEQESFSVRVLDKDEKMIFQFEIKGKDFLNKKMAELIMSL